MKSIFHNSFLSSFGSASSWRSAGSLNSAMAVSPSAGLSVFHCVESLCSTSSWATVGSSVVLFLGSDATGAVVSPMLLYTGSMGMSVYSSIRGKKAFIYINPSRHRRNPYGEICPGNSPPFISHSFLFPAYAKPPLVLVLQLKFPPPPDFRRDNCGGISITTGTADRYTSQPPGSREAVYPDLCFECRPSSWYLDDSHCFRGQGKDRVGGLPMVCSGDSLYNAESSRSDKQWWP